MDGVCDRVLPAGRHLDSVVSKRDNELGNPQSDSTFLGGVAASCMTNAKPVSPKSSAG